MIREIEEDDNGTPDYTHQLALLSLLNFQDSPDTQVAIKLVEASKAGRSEEVATMLVGCSSSQVNSTILGHSPLHLAAHNGHLGVATILLDSTKCQKEVDDKEGDRAIHYAAWNDQVHMLDLLVQKGCNINSRNHNKQTCLHIAAKRGKAPVVSLLLNSGANCNVQDKDGDTPLHNAVSKDNIEVVKAILLGADKADQLQLHITNDFGRNVLHEAAMLGKADSVRLVLQRDGGLVDVPKEDGWTALHLAAGNDHVEVCAVLAQFNATVNLKDSTGATPLHLSVAYQHTEVVEFLVSTEGLGVDINSSNCEGDTPLHLALLSADANSSNLLRAMLTGRPATDPKNGSAIALYLARNGADVRSKNYKSQTPLQLCEGTSLEHRIVDLYNKAQTRKKYDHVSTQSQGIRALEEVEGQIRKLNSVCHEGDIKALKDLLPTLTNYHTNRLFFGHTCLQLAAQCGHKHVCELLLKSGICDKERQDREGNRPLHYAVLANQPAIVYLLASWGVDLNSSNNRQQTAMHLCSCKGLSEIAEILITFYGSNVNAQNEVGDTPIHEAVKHGHINVLQLLLECDEMDLGVQNRKGRNPMHAAAYFSQGECMKLLLQYATLDLVNAPKEDGWTPLHLAAGNNKAAEICVQLVEANGNINAQTNKGCTPLHIAVSQQHSKIIEYLVSKGSNVDIKNADGETALYVAVTMTHTKPDSQAILETFLGHQMPDINKAMAIAEFLVRSQADIHAETTNNQTPLTICPSNQLAEKLSALHSSALGGTVIRPPEDEDTLALEDDSDDSAGGDNCNVCMDGVPEVVFLPCTHMMTCEKCSMQLHQCPVCRVPIEGRIKPLRGSGTKKRRKKKT